MLDRAIEHIAEASALSKPYFEREPIWFVWTCDVETREYVLRGQIVEPPPAGFVVALGEAIHALRQCLDLLAYEIAVSLGGDPPPNAANTGFPIYDQPSKFSDDMLRSKIGDPNKISPELRAILQSAQPFNGGEAQRLSVLLDLDDTGKHRFLPVSLALGGKPEAITDGVARPATAVHDAPTAEEGAEILRFSSAEEVQMNMGWSYTHDIVFGQGTPLEGEMPMEWVQQTRAFILGRIVRPIEALL